MKRIIVIMLVFGFLFGCIGEEQPPVVPEENLTNETEIVVEIEPQENITIVENETEEEPPEEPENVTEIITPVYSEDLEANTGIYFLDACNYGNGDHGAAIFIRKGDFDVLIDAGGTATSGRIVDWLKLRRVDDIDILVSTAADDRRYGGIPDVLDEFEVEEFWWGGDTFSDQAYSAVVEKATQKAKKTRVVERGYRRELNGIMFEALNPKPERFDDVNNDAVVLKLTDRGMVLLLSGNIQTGGQGDLINNLASEIRDIDVMEAPYYGVGAGTANIALFLQATYPGYMIIEGCSDETLEVEGSTRNPFKRVMEQEQYRVEYLETYDEGTVRVMVEETGYYVAPLD
jgi:beta-lactamase superfamily II metal-dependent hydrolase